MASDSQQHPSSPAEEAPARRRRSAPRRSVRQGAAPALRKGKASHHGDRYGDAMARCGIRLTPQRRHVYEALMEQRDHPTALDVFMRVKAKVPSISLATVYNCLEALSDSGLIKPVHLDRGSSRYCPNPVPHGHFFCDQCGAVMDVPLHGSLEKNWEVPSRTVISQAEITLRGLCPECAPDGAA
ncbi:MAG TPA: Fur family transcriptional regulator [Chthoniobacteraceae bacterium]|nr:Fur family transcriptional regulator [Chthoniobacteraceae bacterium]